jgi:heme oxygenase
MPSSLVDTAPRAAHLLRDATHDAHRALESLPMQRELSAGILDRADYVTTLQRHHGLLARWERDQRDWLASLPTQGWTYRPRVPALQQDLAQLGQPLAPLDTTPLQAEDVSARWGMLYVVEGSLLGGRVIARRLRQHRPALSDALAYFDLGSADPDLWRHFQHCLDTVVVDAAARQSAVNGAVAMFGHFHRHLSQEPVQ